MRTNKSLFISLVFIIIGNAVDAQKFDYKIEFPGPVYQNLRMYHLSENEIFVSFKAQRTDTLKIPKLDYKPGAFNSFVFFLMDTLGNVKWAKNGNLGVMGFLNMAPPIKVGDEIFINMTNDILSYDGHNFIVNVKSLMVLKISLVNGEFISDFKPIHSVYGGVGAIDNKRIGDAIYSIFGVRSFYLEGSTDTINPPGYGRYGCILAKQDLTGRVLWYKPFNTWNQDPLSLSNIDVDKDNRLCIIGVFHYSLTFQNLNYVDSSKMPNRISFAVSTDLNGNLLAYRLFKNNGNPYMRSHPLADGRYAMLSYVDTLEGFDTPHPGPGYYLWRLDRDLKPLNFTDVGFFLLDYWTFRYTDIDPHGNIYLNGRFGKVTTINGITYPRDTLNASILSILKYDRWLRLQNVLYDIEGVQQSSTILMTGPNRGFLAGECSGNVRLGALNWFVQGKSMCIGKFEIPNILPDLPDTASIYTSSDANGDIGEFKIYPNPGNGKFTLSLTPGELDQGVISVYSQSGKKVFEKIWEAHRHTQNVEIDYLPAGVYWVQLKTEIFVIGKKLVVSSFKY
jgi:hypothetical protein